MRKFTIGAIALFVLLAMALSATAGPAVHKVTGGGWFIPYEDAEKVTLSFTAQIDAVGNVKGQMQINDRALGVETVHADVIDLEVYDNSALMLVKVTKASDPDMVGDEFPIVVTDNGEGKDTVDMFWGFIPFNGNIQVR